MSVSLLQHPHKAFLSLLGLTILLLSFGAYSDTRALTNSDYWIEQYQKDQQVMNVMWLKQGMQETTTYYENSDALQVLAQNALRKYWLVFVNKNQAYDRYTPIVSGHFVSSKTRANYDFSVTGNSINFRLGYAF